MLLKNGKTYSQIEKLFQIMEFLPLYEHFLKLISVKETSQNHSTRILYY